VSRRDERRAAATLRENFVDSKLSLSGHRFDGVMSILHLAEAVGSFVAVALATSTLLTAVVFGLQRLEVATVPVDSHRRP
jgi:hypothetical protein